MANTEKHSRKNSRAGWSWVPSLYYAEGIPYIIVMVASVAMYKMLGVRNSVLAFWTSILYLPWIIKPLWSPLVEMFSKKRNWIVVMQFLIGVLFLGIGFTIQLPWFFIISLIIFWFIAFSSATHDISADGFYMIGLSEKRQAFFVGIRSTFYRIAMMTGQGLLLIIVGLIESGTGLDTVNLKIYSDLSPQTATEISIDDLNITEKAGKTEIVCEPAQAFIAIKKLGSEKIAESVDFARNRNIESGHINVDKSQSAKAISKASWVLKLEDFIRRHFGEETADYGYAGNIGYVYIYLSNPPAEDQIVVNFGKDSGDKNISLIHGERFIFTRENWNIPAIAVLQLHPNLKRNAVSIFTAKSGKTALAWSAVFMLLGLMFILFALYHRFYLPHPAGDVPAPRQADTSQLREFFGTFGQFFKKKQIGIGIAFLLLYRFSESQLVKLSQPFMLDPRELGGLALNAGQVGVAYGTIGILLLVIGGILGGVLASKYGLKKLLWWMALAINIPNAVYIFLAYMQPDSFLIICCCVGLEQFGYGFGFTAYMLFMIYLAQGEFKTAHYAIATAFMALGMMIPGMWTGWLQEIIGYQHFFLWVFFCIIPIFIVLPFLKIDPTFGIKEKQD